MNMAFASERERDMFLLRKKKMQSILAYNLQEINRKRSLKDYEKYQYENSCHIQTSQALESLTEQNRKKSQKREVEKNILRDSYERQMRDRQQKKKFEKLRDKDYLERQRAFSQYEEARRLADLQKMFDRKTYQGVPVYNHKRSRTEPYEPQSPQYNPEPNHLHLPNIHLKPVKTEESERQAPVQNYESKVSLPPPSTKNNLDNVYVQAIQKHKRMTPKNLS